MGNRGRENRERERENEKDGKRAQEGGTFDSFSGCIYGMPTGTRCNMCCGARQMKPKLAGQPRLMCVRVWRGGALGGPAPASEGIRGGSPGSAAVWPPNDEAIFGWNDSTGQHLIIFQPCSFRVDLGVRLLGVEKCGQA